MKAKDLPKRQRVGGIDAEGVDEPVQIDARIYRNAVLRGAAIRERIDRRDGDAVGIQIAELRPLLEGQAAAIPGRAHRDVVVRDQPGSPARTVRSCAAC